MTDKQDRKGVNWSNCPYWEQCEDERKHIMTYCDVQCSNPTQKHRLDRPKVICLCGSTRFTNEMLIKQWELTKQGFIVLSWCALPEEYFVGEDKAHIGDQEGVKEIVDEVHFRKIDLADEVFVINVNGYIGESTSREIDYATKLGKPIKYLEEVNG